MEHVLARGSTLSRRSLPLAALADLEATVAPYLRQDKAEFLRNQALILVAAGSLVSMKHFHKSSRTRQVSVFLDPQLEISAQSKPHVSDLLAQFVNDLQYRHPRILLQRAETLRTWAEARQLGIVLHSGTFLKVYAAPWRWNMSFWLDQIATSFQPNNIAEAVLVMRELMIDASHDPYTQSDVLSWDGPPKWQVGPGMERRRQYALRMVNAAYRQTYEQDCIED